MGWKLADLYVEFSSKGVTALTGGLKIAAASLTGFAVAGLHSSVEGERLTMMMGHLGREIASLFLPVFETVTQVLQDVVVWFQQLSGTQQHFLGFVGAVVVGIGIVTKALTMMGITLTWATAGISAIVAAGVAFGAFILSNENVRASLGRVMDQFMRIVDIVGPPLMQVFEAIADIVVSVLVPAFELLAATLEPIVQMLELVTGQMGGASASAHRSVSRSGGGTEGVADTYKRLQQAAIKGDVDYPRRQTELLGTIARNTSNTNEGVRGLEVGAAL